MDLTDAQWAILAPLFPKPRVRRDRRGRPWRDPRDVLNGILWILRTGAPWKDLPDRYPSYQTCHRRFQRWVRDGTLRRVLKALAADLHARGGLGPQRDVHRWLLCQRQKKGRYVGKTKRGKGTKIMAIADRAGLPVAITIASASPHETQLVEQTLNASFLPDNPERLIGDAAYDSDGLDQHAGRVRHRAHRAPSAATGSTSPRIGRPFAAINAAGKSNASLPGCRTLGASSPGMSGAPPISPAFCTSHAR